MEHHKILKQLTENTRNAVNNTARHLAPAFLGFALIPSVPQIVLTAVGSALLGGGVGYAIDRRIQTNMETAYVISGLTLLAGFLGTMTMAVATGIPPAITSPIASASVGIASGMILALIVEIVQIDINFFQRPSQRFIKIQLINRFFSIIFHLMLQLPGLIDVHVHLRDPGQTYKEDFFTGTSAALAGGFTTILDMPNNKTPIITLDLLKEKIKEAKTKIVCDTGFYAGSLGDNLEELKKMEPYVFGLKLYLNKTTGNFIINEEKLKKIFQAWKNNKPILVHAESNIIEKVIQQAEEFKKRVHICHVSNKFELKTIIQAKKEGLLITCGVTPHHLFLSRNDADKLGPFGLMKPEIEKEYKEFLWKNLDWIDIIESDHAPHTIEEKNHLLAGRKPPFGVPGLETALPLLLTAVSERKLTLDRLFELCFENPKRIFNIKTDKNTWVEIDEKEEYIIDNKNLKTKCGWSPFHGWKVKGKVKRVFIRGKKVFEDGKLLVKPGSGKIIKPI